MSDFRPRFTRIKDISDRRRLPRLGKIRLGVKVISQKTGKEYPKEVPWFVVPPEVAKIYGPEPTELEVMFPMNDQETVFPQRYAWYGSSRGVKCMGDGERAVRLNEETRDMEDRECPCEKLDSRDCQMRAHLLIILPKVNVGGIYQIDVGSLNSIIDLNSGIDYIQALVGRFAMVPLNLRRVPRETHGSGIKEVHYTLTITLDGDIEFINSLRESTTRILSGPRYALPAPEMVNPTMDEGAIVETEEVLTEEEALEQAKKAGMIPGEETAMKDSNVESYRHIIGSFKDAATLNKWFAGERKNLSGEKLAKVVTIINERLALLIKEGKT